MGSSDEAGHGGDQGSDQLAHIVHSVGEAGAAYHHDHPEQEYDGSQPGDD